MVYGYPKPRYFDQIESGVLFFVAPCQAREKDVRFKAEISQRSQLCPGDHMTYLNINFGRAFVGKIEKANYMTGDFMG